MPPDSLPLTPHKKPLKKAVFLDRDGTINVEKDYLVEPEDFEFISGVPAALKKLQAAGYLLVVVTNQAGIARGYFTPQQVENLHRYMVKLLGDEIDIAGIYYCPHHPTCGQGEYLLDCDCRKGKPGMLLEAAEELSINLSASYMVGDKMADVHAGAAAGCKTFLVRTGYGKQFEGEAVKYCAKVVDDLGAAVDLILSAGEFS